MEVQKVISDASRSLPASQAILLFLSVVLEEDKANHLLQFLNTTSFNQIKPHLDQLTHIPSYTRRFPLLDAVHMLSQKKTSCQLDEFDGSWLLHFLKSEKPSVIALILKHLPADKVYQILNLMEPDLRTRLPDSDSLDQIPEDLIGIIRERFEHQLVKFSDAPAPQRLGFSCLRSLSSHEVSLLVRDLGLDLLAIAFQGVTERPLIELVKNLDESDAEALFEKFHFYRSLSRSEIKSAQMELLGLSLNFANGADLVLEAGVRRLARALLMSEEELVVGLQYKLPLKHGYQLRRYIDDLRNSEAPEWGKPVEFVIQKSQEFIVQRIFELSRSGSIQETWAKLPREKH